VRVGHGLEADGRDQVQGAGSNVALHGPLSPASVASRVLLLRLDCITFAESPHW
jgi:hypothetical protein